jgi:threonine synthase
MPTFATHLESAIDGTRFEPGQLLGTHKDRPLWVRYDLATIAKAVKPADFRDRAPSLWRYRELLPLPSEVEPVTLGEGMTPLLPCPRLGKAMGLTNLAVKDESQLPTGSFKSRGMTTAVSMAKWLGVKRLALPTAGNAGGAAAAYGARAGLEVYVLMPEDTPVVNKMEAALYGAKAFMVNGLIDDCGKMVKASTAAMGWFDLSTLKEPYRLEGKKTMGLELAEQLDWRLPDAILYPTGGGTGLIGMWKAFQELKELGWLKDTKMPRLYSCQSDGCAPIVRAFEKGERFATRVEDAHTVASGLRVPAAVGDFMMLDAIRASGGKAIAGREGRIGEWVYRASGAEGISVCPETGVCFDCLELLKEHGDIRADERVVVFNTGAAQKYLEALPADLPRLEKGEDVSRRVAEA